MADGELTAFQPDIWQCWHETLGSVDRPTWDWEGLGYPYWRIYWNHHPGASVSFNGADYALDPEFVVVVAPNTVVDHHLSGVVEHTYAHATLGYPYDGVVPHVRRIPVEDVPIHLWLFALRGGEDGGGETLDFSQTLAAQAFVLSVFSAFPGGVWPKPATDPAIHGLVREISRHPSRSFRTTDMAERCGMSVNTLLRRFREQIGRSPQQFVADCRLQRACVLLHRTSRSIEQIAEGCGFCDRYHFSKVFKRRYRCGPAAFRHQPFAPRLFRGTP
ncbi:MAG: helix-turn-helix transcriptional regulator [Lentisphaerae bacterium]|jgi:AraC-like DNA-binding protein|nr:helix-turn-helix transcriptional regulator [Lentisphaerota bacterium]MBT4820527.1 helix-turn-helix transcriptional regulator [Lentisphaerota bacterium]MBT5604340.1 helix-turn-helix transcriptional regulator [Lentisphaerota bacterium]MBT7055083.1 helix-turn-helix transcriptional regulator [Lentisphaerota bacterium]MBT7840888.1 helix-turn-helix transcriptional regulator [Lentisphaerota bacterium]